MFTHAQIWQGLDRLAAEKGYSPSGLAKKSGLDPTSFNKSKRLSPEGKPRWPSTESLSKVLAATDSTVSELFSLIDEVPFAPLTAQEKKDIAHRTAEILIKTKSIMFNTKEPFSYTSGNKGPVYIDCRRLNSFPKERNTLMNDGARLLASQIGSKNIDVLAGGETAGISYCALLADRLNKPMVYVRKKPKGHGRMSQIEGVLPEKNKDGNKTNVVLVEDLQNHGSSIKIFIDALRQTGTKVGNVFVIFDYGIYEANKKNAEDLGIKLHSLATWKNVIEVAKARNYFDEETLASVEAFLDDPAKWQEQNC